MSAVASSHDKLMTNHYDALASLFTGILMQLQAASELPLESIDVRRGCLLRAELLARQGLRQVRELFEMGTLMDDGGALIAMRKLFASVARNTSAACEFHVKGKECPLKVSVGVTLQRVLQEALSNAQRFANAKRISVQLCFEEDRIVLEIEDDGTGFVPDKSLSNGLGLLGMRARVDRLGGGLWVRSAPGEGTHLRIDLPNPYVDR